MITISRPSIRRRDMDAVLSCMVTDSLGPGTGADQFAHAVSVYLHLAGGVALRERPRALELAFRRLELEPGSRILLDPLVPRSYHTTILAAGLVPEYVDVSVWGPVIDAAAVEERAQDAAAVITSTHLGFVPEMSRIAATGLPIIEDISHGIGAHTGEHSTGLYGRFVILAVESEGIITAGGGTLLLTGIKKERAALRKEIDDLPPEALLPDLNAALGSTQIKEIEKFIARRNEIAAVFSRAMGRSKHHSITQVGDAESVFYTFPIMIDGSAADVISYAKSKQIECRLPFRGSVLSQYGMMPGAEEAAVQAAEPVDAEDLHDTEDAFLLQTADYPEALKAMLRCVEFPLYPSLTSKEVAAIERVIITLP